MCPPKPPKPPKKKCKECGHSHCICKSKECSECGKHDCNCKKEIINNYTFNFNFPNGGTGSHCSEPDFSFDPDSNLLRAGEHEIDLRTGSIEKKKKDTEDKTE